MRQDPNFILNTLIANREKLPTMRNNRFSYNRQALLKDYLDPQWKLLPAGHDVLDRFNQFKKLLLAVDGFHGQTDCGRNFSMKYKETTEKSRWTNTIYKTTKVVVRIFQPDGAVYEPHTAFSDVMNYSVLSAVNKYESKFWTKTRLINRLDRNIITVKGQYESMPYHIDINISGSSIYASFEYANESKTMSIRCDVPAHIPKEQHHRYKVRTLCQETIIRSHISDLIKQNYMQCCGMTLNSNDRFCRKCGREFDVEDLEIESIKEEGLETILT